MKIILILLSLLLATITLDADKNWIKIEPINQKPKASQKSKSKPKPVNKMMKNIIMIKELIDVSGKKEKVETKDKNWFVLNNEDSN